MRDGARERCGTCVQSMHMGVSWEGQGVDGMGMAVHHVRAAAGVRDDALRGIREHARSNHAVDALRRVWAQRLGGTFSILERRVTVRRAVEHLGVGVACGGGAQTYAA